MATDFGPVPASQVKSESNRIFDALEQGRRVLISRYGKVVAVIDPPSLARHGHMLAAYAVLGLGTPLELTATEIAQGAPGEHIRRAEEGTPSLVTRNSKVYGVLLPHSGEPTKSDPDEEESLLAQFEEAHPDATPAEFAAEVARLKAGDSAEAQIAGPVATLRPELSYTVDDLADTRLWSDATLITAVALEQIGQVGPARLSLNRLIEQLGDEDDLFLRRRVRAARVELARLCVSTGDPDAALRIAADVLREIGPDSTTTADSATIPVQRSNYEHA
jgi:antitoxin (DNA-binding transcriptional repressor) of toxin-antitoxin stability system